MKIRYGLLSVFMFLCLFLNSTINANELNGWTIEDNETYYYENGKKVKWEKVIDGKTYYFDDNGKMYKGLLKYNRDKKYRYFSEDGSMIKQQFVKYNGDTFYFDKQGIAVSWERIINGKTYYFDENGKMYKGLLKYNRDKKYRYFMADGSMAKEEFISINNNDYYFNKEGVGVIWEQTIDGKTYYFDEDAKMHKGLLKYQRDGKYRYFKSNGEMAKNGFFNENSVTRFAEKNGIIKMWENTINGKTYYFDEKGVMYKGLLQYNRDKKNRFFKSDGSMAKNEFISYQNEIYCFDKNGVAYNGWKIFDNDGKIKFFKEDGSMAKNEFISYNDFTYYLDEYGNKVKWEQNISGNTYYFDDSGKMYIGWLKYNRDHKYRYFDGSGKMVKGWLDIKNDRYYLDENFGIMITGSKMINRRNYYFNTSDGRLMQMTAPIPYYMQTDSRWANKKYGSGTMASTGCAQTCAAMAFSFLKNQTILPPDIASWGYKNGYYNGKVTGTIGSFWPAISKHYGIACQGNLTVNQAIDALRHGKLVVAGMNPPNFTFEGTTHEIIIYGIDENNMVSVYDPYFKSHNKKYSINQIFKEKSTDKGDCTSGGPIFALG